LYFNDHYLLVHTPKCGGTYLRKQYNIPDKKFIWDVGHASLKDLNVSSKAQIVGLIREPFDWYLSYYYFCQKSLKVRPQAIDNFPPQHPVSIFSDSGKFPFNEMVENMASPVFLGEVLDKKVVARVYHKDMSDLYHFLKRTQMGFWTWTMMYHFSEKPVSALKNAGDVVKEAGVIKSRTQFIHQENMDQDAAEILGLESRPGKKVNVAPRPKDLSIPGEIKSKIYDLDGEVASILGAYHLG